VVPLLGIDEQSLSLPPLRRVAIMEYVIMMDDHFILSAVRNHLIEALQALLVADIMTERDFRAARRSACEAIEKLDVLLRESHRHPS
jgi:hypothetical protein